MIALPANEQEDCSLSTRHCPQTERQWWPMEGRGSVIPDGNSKFLSPASAGRPPRGCGGAARWCAETQRGTDMTKSKGRASAKPRSGEAAFMRAEPRATRPGLPLASSLRPTRHRIAYSKRGWRDPPIAATSRLGRRQSSGSPGSGPSPHITRGSGPPGHLGIAPTLRHPVE